MVNIPYIDSRDFISLGASVPLNLKTKSVSHDSATIEWEEPKYPNGIIKSYNLIKTTKWRESRVITLEINIVGKHIRYTINNLESETTYTISVSGGTWWRSIFRTQLNICDGVVLKQIDCRCLIGF